MSTTISLTLLFIVLVLVLLFVIFSFSSYFFGGPFVPSQYQIIKKVMDIVEIKEGSVFIDLGSGDGRLLIQAAKQGAFAVGYELNPFWYYISKLNVLLHGVKEKVKVKRENFINADLKEADILYLYLFPEKIADLEKVLRRTLKQGAKIITYKFPFSNWQERKRLEKEKIYLYVKE